MKTEGKVIAINSNVAIVEVKRKGACGDHCAHCKGCDAQTMQIEVVSDFSVQIGDWVLLQSDTKAVLLGFLVLFIAPLVLPLLIYTLTFESTFCWLFSAVAFLLAIFAALLLNKNEQYLKCSKPYILDIIKKENVE